MKLVSFLLLLYCFECQANESLNMSNSELADGLQKMVAHRGKIVQKILYRTVEYCSNEFPDTAKLYLETKKKWDKHNLPIVNGSQPISTSLLLNNGIEQKEIAMLTKALLSSLKTSSQEKKTKDLILKLSSKTKMKQRRGCNSTAKSFSGGRFNLNFLVLADYRSMKNLYKAFPNEFRRRLGGLK